MGVSGVEVVYTQLHAGGKFSSVHINIPAGCTAWAPALSTR
ncbi:MAG: hypothetical protein V8Q85_05595 [Christensenellales bacterium]